MSPDSIIGQACDKAYEDHTLRQDRCDVIPLGRTGKRTRRPKNMRALFEAMERKSQEREAVDKFYGR